MILKKPINDPAASCGVLKDDTTRQAARYVSRTRIIGGPSLKSVLSTPPNIDPLSLWAVLRVQDSFFSVPCDCVQSIVALADVKSIPTLPKDVRGIMHHRDQVVYLIDMRARLNIHSLKAEVDEFTELMNAREQDHIEWLNTLQSCINEEKEFTLTSDPRRCKFGEWYYEFLPTVKNIALKSLLERFEKLHNDIHSTATLAENFLRERKKKEAIELIESKRNNELRRMIGVFTEVKRTYQSLYREIVVVLEHANRQFALVVDEVTAITNLSWDHWQSMDEIMLYHAGSEYIAGIAEIPDNGLPVAILDVSRLS